MGDEFAFLYLTPNGECLPYVERVSCGWSIIRTWNGEGSKWRLQPAARAEKQTSPKDCCSTQFFFLGCSSGVGYAIRKDQVHIWCSICSSGRGYHHEYFSWILYCVHTNIQREIDIR